MIYQLNSSILLSHIAEKYGLQIVGNDIEITAVSRLDVAATGVLTFSKNIWKQTFSCAAIAPPGSAPMVESKDCALLISENPRLIFIRALDFLYKTIGFDTHEFKSTMHPSVKLGNNVVIEDGCMIEEGVILEHNVVVHSGTRIGKNSRIRANSSIGGDGFGFERAPDGSPVRFVHLGGVKIGQDVEIGSNTCIARGTLGDTVIEDNVKIDNLVHVAHNCHIEQGAFVIACAELSGGVTVGQNAWVGPNACVLQQVAIGNNALVGLGAVVTKNLDANTVYAGNPAKRLRSI